MATVVVKDFFQTVSLVQALETVSLYKVILRRMVEMENPIWGERKIPQ
jgi:hypothetical protein